MQRERIGWRQPAAAGRGEAGWEASREASAAAGPTRRRLLRRAGALAVGGTAGGAGVLAACGPFGDQAAGTGQAGGQPVKLTYLHQWSQTQGHGPITDQLAARFREQFPAIQVEPAYTAEYYTKLATIVAGGDLPDVVTYNLAFLPQLVKKGVVVSPEALAKGPYRFDKADLVPAAREMATFDGKLMVIPYVLNSSGLAHNRTLFKQKGLDPAKLPATWTELVDVARQVTGRSGDTDVWGTVFPRGTADPVSPLLALIWQNGGDLVDTQRRVAVWNSPAAVEALQFQVDLVHRHRVASFPNPANGEQGNVGIWHIPPGNVSALQIRVRDAFEWGTGHLPRGKQQATTVGGHSLAVLKTNRHHEQAWRFIHWYTAPPQNAEYLVATTTLPPWRASEQQGVWQRYVREEPRIKPFVEMLAYGRPTPKLVLWQDIVDILAQERDAAGAQQKTPKEALDDAARLAEPLIQQG